MTEAQRSLFDDALRLPGDLRSELAELLLASLPPELRRVAPIDEDIQAAWAAEARRRMEQVNRGEAELLSAEEFGRRLGHYRGA